MFLCFVTYIRPPVTGQVIPAAGAGGEAGPEKPSAASSDPPSQELSKSVLVMSGGEGYIDFRMGKGNTRAE